MMLMGVVNVCLLQTNQDDNTKPVLIFRMMSLGATARLEQFSVVVFIFDYLIA